MTEIPYLRKVYKVVAVQSEEYSNAIKSLQTKLEELPEDAKIVSQTETATCVYSDPNMPRRNLMIHTITITYSVIETRTKEAN